MKIVKSKYNKQENKNQPWFDAECQTLRSQTLKALRKFRMLQPDESLRAYQHSKKVFRTSTSDKKRQYVNIQTLKLSHDKDEKSFWNFLKGSRDSLPIDISAQDWFLKSI